jgi:ABC-2 type transport system ATP-binding protein
MRRRLDIAASLIVTCDLLFLDEPTTGLDPRSRGQVWDTVRAIAAAGTTVLLTTQYLEEADRLADRLAVIDHGRLIAEGTSRELKASVGGSTLQGQLSDPAHRAQAAAIAAAITGGAPLPASEPTTFAVKVEGPAQATALLAALAEGGITLGDFALGAPSLDDVFFAITGHPAEDAQAKDAPAQAGGGAA